MGKFLICISFYEDWGGVEVTGLLLQGKKKGCKRKYLPNSFYEGDAE